MYGNSTCDASGYSEGEELIGAGKVTVVKPQNAIEGSGSFSIAVSSPSNLISRHASAIARRSNGDTSEFASCLQFIAENTAPSFQNLTLNFPRATAADTVVATLTAVDDGLPQPASLTFSLLTQLTPFTVAADGTLRVTQANVFDASSIYNLDIKVSDGEKSTTGIVTILPTELFRDGFEDPLP